MKFTTFSLFLSLALGSTLISAIPLHESDSFADLAERDGEYDLLERDFSYDSGLYGRDVGSYDSELFERDFNDAEVYERDLTGLEADALFERDLDYDGSLYERDFDPDGLYERDVGHDMDLYGRGAVPKPIGPGGRGSGGAEIGNALANLIIGLQNEPGERGDFVKKLLDTTGKAKPGFNVIAIHTKHSYKFEGVQGKDWGHEHAEFQRDAVPGSFGFEIYWFHKGWLNNEGDGGWLNWGYTGSPKREDKKLTY